MYTIEVKGDKDLRDALSASLVKKESMTVEYKV
jgi:hypothetical protein